MVKTVHSTLSWLTWIACLCSVTSAIRQILCVPFTVQIAEVWVKSEPAVFLLIHLPSDGCASLLGVV